MSQVTMSFILYDKCGGKKTIFMSKPFTIYKAMDKYSHMVHMFVP